MVTTAHATTIVSRAPDSCDAAQRTVPPPMLGRMAFTHWPQNTRTPEGDTKAAVELSPHEIVDRRASTWNGMAAEAIHITKHRRFESSFRAPVHLLALFEDGERSDGSTFVEGLPRSGLRIRAEIRLRAGRS